MGRSKLFPFDFSKEIRRQASLNVVLPNLLYFTFLEICDIQNPCDIVLKVLDYEQGNYVWVYGCIYVYTYGCILVHLGQESPLDGFRPVILFSAQFLSQLLWGENRRKEQYACCFVFLYQKKWNINKIKWMRWYIYTNMHGYIWLITYSFVCFLFCSPSTFLSYKYLILSTA